MPSKQLRRRDKHFELQGGCCFYCGGLMDKGPFAPGTALPPNACTTEHTIPKGHPLRGRQQRIVAACLQCNRQRNAEFIEASRLHAALAGKLYGDLSLRGYLLQDGKHVPELIARRVKHEALPVASDHDQGPKPLALHDPVQHRDRRSRHPWMRSRRRPLEARRQAQPSNQYQEKRLHHSTIPVPATGS